MVSLARAFQSGNRRSALFTRDVFFVLSDLFSSGSRKLGTPRSRPQRFVDQCSQCGFTQHTERCRVGWFDTKYRLESIDAVVKVDQLFAQGPDKELTGDRIRSRFVPDLLELLGRLG